MAETRRLRGLAATVADRSSAVGSPAVAALSGGADSAVAAWLVARSGSGRAIHVDHGQEGSGLLRSAARDIASVLGLDLKVIEVTPGGRSEATLRSARYGALWEHTRSDEWVVLGHTADDQAETVMMNLMRGAGLEGMAGMPAARGRLVRPLLGVWRSETRELATLLGLPWVDDPSNRDLRYFRNRVRLDLMPHIERSFAPAFSAGLVRAAAALRDDLAILDDAVGSIPVDRSPRRAAVPLDALRREGPELSARVVRREVARLGDGSPPNRDAVLRVIEVVDGRRRSAQVGGGITASRTGEVLCLEAAPRRSDPVEFRPGTLRWGALRLDVRLTERGPAIPFSNWAAVIPLAEPAGWPRIRAVEPSDVVGAPGRERPASQAIEGAGLATADDPGPWPVVEVGDRIVWIPGAYRASSTRGEARSYLCAVAAEDEAWGPFAP
ncbi:MAG TPA: tRNA lysidine(34) synthetase TilS [Acidimicrobiia bacterium]